MAKKNMKEGLSELMLYSLRDLFDAEKQVQRALPKIAKLVQNEDLKEGLLAHKEETDKQIERLEDVADILEIKLRRQHSDSMAGLIQNSMDLKDQFGTGPTLDAGIIAAQQAVEHLEIAYYGSAIAWAQACGQEKVVQLLTETLEEEKKTDILLTKIATEIINEQSAEQDPEITSSKKPENESNENQEERPDTDQSEEQKQE